MLSILIKTKQILKIKTRFGPLGLEIIRYYCLEF